MKITHDFHVHTALSLCAKPSATVENYMRIARREGIVKMGFANHFWDEAVSGANEFYAPQNYAHVASLKPALEAAEKNGVEVYFGCECEYDPWRHGVACTPETAEKFDFMIVPNSHTHMMMPKSCYHPYEKHAAFMVNAYEEILQSEVAGYITAMAHPFEAVCCPYDNEILIRLISRDDYKRLFTLQAEKGIAFEVNVASMMQKSPAEIEASAPMMLFRLAKACGCRFLFGSDAHSDTAHDTYSNASLVAEMLELTPDDLAPIAR